MTDIKSIKELEEGQIEVLTSTSDYYFTKERESITIDAFDSKIEDNDKAFILNESELYELPEELNSVIEDMNGRIGKKASEEVLKFLKIRKSFG